MTTANAPTPTSQASRLPRSPRSACAVGEREQAQPRAARCRAPASRPLPMSRRAASAAPRRAAAPSVANGRSRTSGRGPVNGRSSSAQPSGVTQRSQPRPPGRVGDHPQREARPRARPSQMPGRHAPRRRELARQRADAGEDRHDRDDRERQVGRRPAGDPPAAQPGEHRDPEHGGPAPIAASAARKAAAPADDAREHELRAARVLLARAARGPRRAAPHTAAKIARRPPTRQAV